MKKQLDPRKAIRLLKKTYPDAACGLAYHNAYELITAVILSAQCTDKKVNEITPALFKKYPTPQNLARGNSKDIERLIKQTGFYKNKAKNIKGMAASLVQDFGGHVPDTMDALITLPGVGRKTANVILSTWHKKPQGIVVDTHMIRLTNLWGWVHGDNAERIERELVRIIPKKEWEPMSHLVIAHGRAVCIARRPKCEICILRKDCPSSRAPQ